MRSKENESKENYSACTGGADAGGERADGFCAGNLSGTGSFRITSYHPTIRTAGIRVTMILVR